MRERFSLVPGFVSDGTKRLFTLDYRPNTDPRATILFAPPFAEEMNRSRHMVSRQARLFASSGYRVVIVDLSGTGDSHGALASASLDTWSKELANVTRALQFDESLPVVLWALRLGALIGLNAVQKHSLAVDSAILWSPCISGSTYMKELLRLKLLASVLGSSDKRESVGELQARILDGATIEIAGYKLAPELYKTIAESEIFGMLKGLRSPVTWFEMVANTESAIPPHIAMGVDSLNSREGQVSILKVVGAKFWSTTEITVSEDLAKHTLDCLAGLNDRIEAS